MSAYHEYATEFRDQECLVDALRELGYLPDVHPQASTLYDYHGNPRSQTANVIVPRAQLAPAANDLGFVLGDDGRYTAIVSEFDRDVTFTVAREAMLKQEYAVAKAKKLARQHGRQLVRREEKNGSIRLVFAGAGRRI